MSIDKEPNDLSAGDFSRKEVVFLVLSCIAGTLLLTFLFR